MAKGKKDEIPEKLRPFIKLGFDNENAYWSGKERVGTCPFCYKEDKFYINSGSGLWSCKTCGKEGNQVSFIRKWYASLKKEIDADRLLQKYKSLGRERGLPWKSFKEKGFIWSDDLKRWVIPIYNKESRIVTLRFYIPGKQTIALSGMPLAVWGVEELEEFPNAPIFWVEGETDRIALELLCAFPSNEGIVLCLPGATTFKDEWSELAKGRDNYTCLDNDKAGKTGTKRLHKEINNISKGKFILSWPEELPNGFDIRDLYHLDGADKKKFLDLFIEYTDENSKEKEERKKEKKNRALLDLSKRPTFDETITKYKKWIKFNPDLEAALRVIFAVIYSNQIQGDPVWLHIASPPGSGKTALLQSTETCPDCVFVSSMGPHTLVSGFKDNSEEASLLPSLMDNILVIKDFTEILKMQKQAKEEVYSTLRGAYDGRTRRKFGNGKVFECNGFFSILSGVTQEIFAETETDLGERFLILHVFKGNEPEVDDIILAALSNFRGKSKMNEELCQAAIEFLNFNIDEDLLPELTHDEKLRLISLAHVTSRLRAGVKRDFKGERELYRPQMEIPTRVSVQFEKLLLGLALCNDELTITEKEFNIITRVALDTCKGFEFEITKYVFENPGCSMKDISDFMKVSHSTIDIAVKNLITLETLDRYRMSEEEFDGPGKPPYCYRLSDYMIKHWKRAKLDKKAAKLFKRKPRIRKRFSKSKGD